MNDIRIPYWRSRGRGFGSLILQEKRLHGLLDGAKKKLVVVIPVLLRIWIITITSLVEVLNTQTSETGGEHMLGNGEPGVPMSTAI